MIYHARTRLRKFWICYRAVLVVCLGIYVAGALVGFDDYGKICLSADRVLWHGEGAPSAGCLRPEFGAAGKKKKSDGDYTLYDSWKLCVRFIDLREVHPYHAECPAQHTMLADAVIQLHTAVWRFFTAAVFHLGALHVAFNMLAFVPIGAPCCCIPAACTSVCSRTLLSHRQWLQCSAAGEKDCKDSEVSNCNMQACP